MNIISIDSAKANIGIYIRKGNSELYTTINTTKKKTKADKYLHIRNEMKRLCEENKIKLAFLEDYTFSVKRSQSVTSLAEVKGLILITLYELDISVIMVNPSTWKAMCKLALPSKKNKKEYVDSVNAYYKKMFKSTDECDAYLMLLSMYYICKGVVKTDSHLILQKKMKAFGNIFQEQTNEKNNN